MGDGSDRPRWVRCIVLATKRDDISQEEFDQHWRNVHAEIAKRYPNVIRYSQLMLRSDIASDDGLPVHGIVDFIYTSAEDIPNIWESPAGKEGIEDAPKFCATTTKFYVDERVVTDHLGLGSLTERELVSEPEIYP